MLLRTLLISCPKRMKAGLDFSQLLSGKSIGNLTKMASLRSLWRRPKASKMASLTPRGLKRNAALSKSRKNQEVVIQSKEKC